MSFVVVALVVCFSLFGNAYSGTSSESQKPIPQNLTYSRAHLFSISASLPNKPLRHFVPTADLICKDGKGPLLEGEGSPFPCAGECPEGFECEHPLEGEALGICCPNLEVLYDLYGKNNSEDELPLATTEPAPVTTLGTKEVRAVHAFDDSWQETSEVPETVPAQTETVKPDGSDFGKARL